MKVLIWLVVVVINVCVCVCSCALVQIIRMHSNVFDINGHRRNSLETFSDFVCVCVCYMTAFKLNELCVSNGSDT